ncbi:MAG: YbdD/YjiX family protein [Myxococcaceae bacterium]
MLDGVVARLKTVWMWSARTARLMVGVPDYENYVEHRKLHHPRLPIMTRVEFFRERQNARYAVEKGRFKGCC